MVCFDLLCFVTNNHIYGCHNKPSVVFVLTYYVLLQITTFMVVTINLVWCVCFDLLCFVTNNHIYGCHNKPSVVCFHLLCSVTNNHIYICHNKHL